MPVGYDILAHPLNNNKNPEVLRSRWLLEWASLGTMACPETAPGKPTRHTRSSVVGEVSEARCQIWGTPFILSSKVCTARAVRRWWMAPVPSMDGMLEHRPFTLHENDAVEHALDDHEGGRRDSSPESPISRVQAGWGSRQACKLCGGLYKISFGFNFPAWDR